MSLIQVNHISGDNHHSSFCMSDGSVRMVGKQGRYGAFGSNPLGKCSQANISSYGVSLQSMGNKHFIPPPKIQNEITQCVSDGIQTFALLRSDIKNLKKVIYWGSFLKKEIKNIPSVATSIINMNVCGFIFVNEHEGHYHYTRNDGYDYINTEMMNSAKSTVILSCFLSSSISYCYREDGICHIGYIDLSKKNPSFKTIIVKNCHWVTCDKRKVVYCYGENRDIQSVGCPYLSPIDRIMTSFPAIVKSIKYIEHIVSQNSIVILTTLGEVYVYSYQTDGIYGPYCFSCQVNSISSGFAILKNGIAIPLIMSNFSEKDEMKVLSVIPEWSDNEDAVYDICKISPENLLFASTRLRKSISFSKKIILLGSHTVKYIDGVVRRNAEIRPIIKLYALSSLST